MTARIATQRDGRVRYRTHLATAAIPLALAGLYAVHTSAGATGHISYCEPATGRCSCGADAGSCPHLAIAHAHAAMDGRALPLIEEVA